MERSGLTLALIRRWRTVVTAIVLVAAVSVGVGSFAETRYEVRARFMVMESVPELAGTPFVAATGSMGWQALFAPLRSDSMVSAALADVGVDVDSVGDFVDEDLELVPDTHTHVVTMSAVIPGSEEQALDFATSMLSRLGENNVEEFNRALDARIEVLRQTLDLVWNRVQVYPLPDTYDEPLAGGTEAYGDLSYELAQAEVARAADKQLVVIMSPPHATKESPSPLKNGVVGVALGLVAGLGIALIMDARDARGSRG